MTTIIWTFYVCQKLGKLKKKRFLVKIGKYIQKSDNHGGVAVICKPSQSFISEQVTEFDSDVLEAVCVHIRPEKLQSFLLVVSYIPPSKTDLLNKMVEILERASQKYNNIICTGDFNAKSQFWLNVENNAAGNVLENFMLNSDFICVNDGAPTRRNVTSVIDLFLIKSQFHRNVSCCVTLTHECVRSDHIPILLELDDGIVRNVRRGGEIHIEKDRLGEMEGSYTKQFSEVESRGP